MKTKYHTILNFISKANKLKFNTERSSNSSKDTDSWIELLRIRNCGLIRFWFCYRIEQIRWSLTWINATSARQISSVFRYLLYITISYLILWLTSTASIIPYCWKIMQIKYFRFRFQTLLKLLFSCARKCLLVFSSLIIYQVRGRATNIVVSFLLRRIRFRSPILYTYVFVR